jgi:hypothetical protein
MKCDSTIQITRMKIERDKWKHFFVGIGMGVVIEAFLHWLVPDHRTITTIITFFIVVAISYGFELYSKFTGRGHYELMDAVAAVIGGIIGMGAAYVVGIA